MFVFFKKVKNKKIKKEKGFSLMELIVVIALTTIILGVSLFNYDQFGKEMEIENEAYKVSLHIREAQVYGINKLLKEVATNPEGSFSSNAFDSYGVNFDISTNGSKREFVLFLDNNKNGLYDGNYNNLDNQCVTPETTECFSYVTLGAGNSILNLEYFDTDWNNTNVLNISFKRPNPDAFIRTNNTDTTYSKAKITLSSKNDTEKYCVIIGSAGDITPTPCN